MPQNQVITEPLRTSSLIEPETLEREALPGGAQDAHVADTGVRKPLRAGARATGAKVVAGVDEVGRGALFGPVVAAAVILPEGCRIPGLRDSKQLIAKNGSGWRAS